MSEQFGLCGCAILTRFLMAILQAVAEVMAGTILIAAAVQNYIPYGRGWLAGPMKGGLVARLLLGMAGLCVALPGLAVVDIPISNGDLLLVGILLTFVIGLHQRHANSSERTTGVASSD